MATRYTKDGVDYERWASTPEQQVNLEADGWVPADAPAGGAVKGVKPKQDADPGEGRQDPPDGESAASGAGAADPADPKSKAKEARS